MTNRYWLILAKSSFNLSEVSSEMGCYSTIILTCECVRSKDFYYWLTFNLRILRIFLKKKKKNQLPCATYKCKFGSSAIVVIELRTKPPHKKEMYLEVLTTKSVSILPAETEPTHGLSLMKHPWLPLAEHPLWVSILVSFDCYNKSTIDWGA